ncbi:putative glutamine-dependent NAD(+) synthetase [Candidatus Phytoplasma oryzae]|uniref:Glutamine-dependent NAD(+) synthetase n=1 Tax=Candidatus Phytoplasma oryzae TaxID=203274 RepID=A0A139JQF7_9MOLU|nr:putative glutamine-dependent NAD(+) synthetase [Candidatus Phytoplasma oryzae]KXT29202.1 putative glutamine-dependent NAD(+) synthetase [Candidatus Phytoplasma oryzae]
MELSSPILYIGNPFKNAQSIISILNKSNASFVLFSELCLSSYSAGDLFFDNNFLQKNLKALSFILENTSFGGVYFIGMPFCFEELVYNVAVVVQNKKILGIVPKHTIPNYKEFNEKRWFQSGKFIQSKLVKLLEQKVPFGNILFINKDFNVVFGVEICQDLWTIESPSDLLVLNGAHLIFNLSASTEHIGKSQLRKMAVLDHSRKHIGGYFYTSSGITESAMDTIFSNHKIAAVLGEVIGEKDLFNQDISLVVDVSIDVIKYQRIIDTTYGDQKIGKEIIFLKSYFELKEVEVYNFEKDFESKPFIVKENLEENLKISRSIQLLSLKNQLSKIDNLKVFLYMKEELHEFLTLLNIIKSFKDNNKDFQDLNVILDPNIFVNKELFAVLKDFLNNNKVNIIINDIFLKKENEINKILVLESYNLSDIAIGNIQYNLKNYDFLYNVNIGISNTFMIELILFHFRHNFLEINNILKKIYLKKINNFLTKELIIKDFILYHYLKHNFGEEKIAFLIKKVFSLTEQESEKIVKQYMKFFFQSQSKRQKMAAGPKIFEYSLSYRTELKIPLHLFE